MECWLYNGTTVVYNADHRERKRTSAITTKVWTEVEFLDLFNKMELVRGEERKVGIKFATFPITNNMIKNFSFYMRCIHHSEHFISDSLALDLIDKLLTLNSNKRPDIYSAMGHNFFGKQSMPSPLLNKLSEHSKSMFLYSIHSNRQSGVFTAPQNQQKMFEDHYQK